MSCNHLYKNNPSESLTVGDLVKRFPSLIKRSNSQKGINERLLECGYILGELEDIIRAQKSEDHNIDLFLSCKVEKTICCL